MSNKAGSSKTSVTNINGEICTSGSCMGGNGEEALDANSSDDETMLDADLEQLEIKLGGRDKRNIEMEKSDKALFLSPSTEKLETKMKEESMEFAFLQPVCAQVLHSPSEKNLRILEERLDEIGNLPIHLSEFVVFPFAIHLKIIKNYEERHRLQIYRTLAKLLLKADLGRSFDVFKSLFQKLVLGLTTPSDFSKDFQFLKEMFPEMTLYIPANIGSISEDEMRAILDCLNNISIVSLSSHLSTLCEPDKVQIFGHPIYILLQLVVPDCSKSVRLKTLDILTQMVKLCDSKKERSEVLFTFLPGIISSLRKLCVLNAGTAIKAISIKSINLMGMTIRICTEFKSSDKLTKADEMLGKIIEILCGQFILSEDVDYRRSFFQFCSDVVCRSQELPNCFKTVTAILFQMKEDSDASVSEGCMEILGRLGVVNVLSFDDLLSLLESATGHLRSGDDDSCVLTLREASSILSTKNLTFIEFKTFLSLTFDFMNEVVWKYRNRISVDNVKVTDSVFEVSKKFCKNLAKAGNIDEIVYELSDVILNLQNNFNSVKSPTGVIVTFNLIISELLKRDDLSVSEFEAANFSEALLSLIDMQSTEVVLNELASDTPAVQSFADIRRAYLLEGLGILGHTYPKTIIPIILYPLIEHAGTVNSEVVNDAAEQSLKSMSAPMSLPDFLQTNVDFILNEIGLRMLNLGLYPNCPNAMIFLARYFDFSKDSFADFIDKIFEQCSDQFGGGNMQHIYAKVFYALIKSISSHCMDLQDENVIEDSSFQKKSLLQRLSNYQTSIGVTHPSARVESVDNLDISEELGGEQEENSNVDVPQAEDDDKLNSIHNLVVKISHRVLNFLPNGDRSVRLIAMDCLIFGLPVLKHHENSLLPLAHTIWQNLVPRLDEKDYVIVRKSFELLKTLCICCGGFLKKRTIEEAFPKLSTLLLTLAKDAEQVKNKNRQYYTYTQSYKLQLTVLQGMGVLLDAIDVQEFELDKIVSGCIMYLNPDQHKNLRDAAVELMKTISEGKHCRTVWMKLIACGIKKAPKSVPHPEFVALPDFSNL